MSGTNEPSELFRTVNTGGRSITVQTRPASKTYALEHVDEFGNYTAVLALNRYFYADAINSSEGVETLSDQLAAALANDLDAYGLAEKIVGFDHESEQVLVEVTNDVVSAAKVW